jgi:hypothetical protein
MEVKMKPEITLPPNGLFKTHKAYSPEEILAAGGATAFGKKSGKNNKNLIKALKNAPPAEPFTQQEWDQTMQQLRDSK